MEKMLLVAVSAFVTALAVLRLVQMLQWVRCKAVFLAPPGADPLGLGFQGNRLPIRFQLRDGTEMQATLRLYGKMAMPANGARLRIIYDPADPGQVEWAASLVVLALIMAVLAATTVSLLVHAVVG